MKTKIFNLIARVTAIATVASSFYMVSPVKAADMPGRSGPDTVTISSVFFSTMWFLLLMFDE